MVDTFSGTFFITEFPIISAHRSVNLLIFLSFLTLVSLSYVFNLFCPQMSVNLKSFCQLLPPKLCVTVSLQNKPLIKIKVSPKYLHKAINN